MSRYFGTDGFRGEANINLTADHAYQVGRFLGWYYNEKRAHAAEEGRPVKEGPARIVIGKDTRRSSYMFEYSLVAGLVASGADAYMLTARQMVPSDRLSSATTRLVARGSSPRSTHSTLA